MVLSPSSTRRPVRYVHSCRSTPVHVYTHSHLLTYDISVCVCIYENRGVHGHADTALDEYSPDRCLLGRRNMMRNRRRRGPPLLIKFHVPPTRTTRVHCPRRRGRLVRRRMPESFSLPVSRTRDIPPRARAYRVLLRARRSPPRPRRRYLAAFISCGRARARIVVLASGQVSTELRAYVHTAGVT